MSRNLTLKCSAFCRDYVIRFRGDGTRAAMANFDCKSERVAAAVASEYLTKPNVIEEIDRIKATLPENLTEEVIAQNIAYLAFNGKTEATKTKNLELLAKWKAMLTEKRENTNRQTFETSKELKGIETKDLILELEARLKLSSQGVNTSENVKKA